jgi:hypothetical protein
MKRVAIWCAITATTMGFASAAHAQSRYSSTGRVGQAPAASGVNWGTASTTVHTLWALDFGVFDGTPGQPDDLTAGVTCATGQCIWLGNVNLPSGAAITSVELSACDQDSTQEVTFALMRTTKSPGGPEEIVSFQGTGFAETPGCTTFGFTLPTPHTIDNDGYAYVVDVNASPGIDIQWNQFRIYYRLQTSAPPAAATFADVPVGHPQRRFVEALVSAGVTGGCGGGNYCPDLPVTRGQMAVFLAVALGLHFPN